MVNKIVYLRFKTIQRHKITMKTINDFNFSNKKAIIRVDFNVPLNERFEVTDDNRIVAAKPTIDKIVNEGGIAVLMSHLGRPKNGPEDRSEERRVGKADSSWVWK